MRTPPMVFNVGCVAFVFWCAWVGGSGRAFPQNSRDGVSAGGCYTPPSKFSRALLRSTFWRAMVIPLRLRTILLTTMRWTAAWAVIGLLIGIAMTLGSVPPIAEPGAPSGYAFYVFQFAWEWRAFSDCCSG